LVRGDVLGSGRVQFCGRCAVSGSRHSLDFSNPQTLNRFAYVTNNPLSLTDATGLQQCSDQQNTAICQNGYSWGLSYFINHGGWDSLDLVTVWSREGNPSSHMWGWLGSGNSGSGPANCVNPTAVQRAAISVAGAAARFLKKTVLWGVGGSAGAGAGKGWGIYGSGSMQIAVSPNGNAAYVFSFSAPALVAGQDAPGVVPYIVPSTKGFGMLGGSQIGFSNATDPSQLEGQSVDASGSMAEGIGIGGDVSISTSSPFPYQANVTLGFGAGGRGAAGAITNTAVKPICQ
jgi:hypothetical protein